MLLPLPFLPSLCSSCHKGGKRAALCSCLPLLLKRSAGGSVLLLPLCSAPKEVQAFGLCCGLLGLLLPSFSAALPPPVPARFALLCLLFGLFACLLGCPKEGGPPVPALPPVRLSSCLCLPPRLSVLPLPSPLPLRLFCGLLCALLRLRCACVLSYRKKGGRLL